MQFKRRPVYRKTIYPWYDSEAACIITILLAAVFLFFGIIGIRTALHDDEYRPYAWLPMIISALSIFIIISNLFRLTKKLFRRFSEKGHRIDMGDG